MLIVTLKPEIRSKGRGKLSKGIVLLHDTARPHAAAHTQLKPSRNSTLRYWHTFRTVPISPLQTIACLVHSGRRYGVVDSPRTKNWRKRCMRGLLLSQKHFFSEGIKNVVQWWKTWVEKQGDYVEKWCYYEFYTSTELQFVSVIITDSPT